jgi:ABC-type phosphate transport system substrate-binding protein
VKRKLASIGTMVAGLGLIALPAAGVAHADTNAGNTTTLAVVGSDTTQNLMEGLSQVVLGTSNNPLLSNYLATPVGRNITTRTGNANCTFAAPNNSSGGRDALSAAMRSVAYGGSPNLAGCVDVARSSSGGNPTTSPGVGSMTYIPFATDAVTFATQAVTSVGHKLAKSDLVAIYTANTPNCFNKEPLLPAMGSGTRSFFVGQLGLSDVAIGAPNGPGTCVKDTLNGTPIQEHDGRVLVDAAQLIPFSVAQYQSQAADVIPNQLGSAALGAIDVSANPDGALSNAVGPTALQGSFPFARPVYNVVPTNQLTAGTPTNNLFNGPTSQVCSATPTIERYGFAHATNCGDTSKKNTN